MDRPKARKGAFLRCLLGGCILPLLLSCAVRASDQVGEVNGEQISESQFNAAVKQQFEQYVLEHGKNIDNSVMRELHDAAWKTLVESIILRQQYTRYHIVVTESEVKDSKQNNPPEFIRKAKIFGKNGRFQPDLLKKALDKGEPYDLTSLKNFYYSSYIPFSKLKQAIWKSVPVSDEEIEDEYRIRFCNLDLTAVFIDPSSLPEPTVSQKEIGEAYQRRKREFYKPESARLDIMMLPVTPTVEDNNATKARIDSIYSELKRGMSFGILADRYSRSDYPGNEVGFIAIDSLPASVKQDWVRSEYSEASRPFFSDDGWRIYDPVSRTKNLVRVREIFLPVTWSARTKAAVHEKAIQVRDLARSIGLRRAADEFDLTILSADSLNRDNTHIPGLGEGPGIVHKALESLPNDLFPPVFNEKKNCYVIVQVREVGKARTLTELEVSDKLMADLKVMKQREMAKKLAQEVAGASDPILRARIEGLPIVTEGEFTVDTPLTGEPDTRLNRAILEPGTTGYLDPMEGGAGWWVIRVDSVVLPEPKGLEREKARIEEIVREAKKTQYFENWLRELKEDATINDWRDAVQKGE